MKKTMHETKPQEKITNYIIGGWFAYPSITLNPIVFWGRFKHSESLLRDGKIDGELLDKYGSSKIKGVMNDRGLDFEKRYDDRKDFFEYNFEKRNGVWVGEYKNPMYDMIYPTTAFTGLIDENDFVTMGLKIGLKRDNKLLEEDYYLTPFSF